MQSQSVPGSHFLPTVRPEDVFGNHLTTDLHAFPSHINSSFLPPELDSIKNSIDSSNPEPTTIDEPNEDTTFIPTKNLFNFPPNIDAAYLPPKTRQKSPASSYLPIPAGDDPEDDSETDDNMTYNAPEDLNSFPPNIGSVYPKTMHNKALGSSYLPPPADTVSVEEPNEETTFMPPKNLFNFPPNVEAVYLPPQNRQKPPENSYLPIPSGNDFKEDEETDDNMSYNAPEDLNNFPPNIGSVYPKTKESQAFGSSYLSPPSGHQDDSPLNENVDGNQADKFFPYSYTPPENPYKFPPNVQSLYLPPEMRQVKQSINSYLPPASGSVSGYYEGSKPTITDAPQMNMAPPPDMMAPPADMMAQPPDMMMDMPPPDHHHSDHHHDHPPW